MAELIPAGRADVVDRVVEVLRDGGTVVLPTDTVYGLAALPGRPDAIRRIFELKQRPGDMHLAVLVAEPGDVRLLSTDPRPEVEAVCGALWPGPLTVVLGQATTLAAGLGGDDRTVGVRCPEHDLVRAIAREVGPIATTSANLHGQRTPETAGEIAEAISGTDLVIDGGRCTGGVASTVVSLTGEHPVILRPGPVDHATIEAVWSLPPSP